MSKINTVIPKQKFEYIRDRVFEIIMSEFEGQYLQSYDPDLDLSVFIERSTPLDKTELPGIVVSLAAGNFGNKNQGSVDGTYQINIDHYTSAKSAAGVSGDTYAAKKLHKILGISRAILEDPIYKTLGFTPPFIMKSFISELNIAAQNKEDAENTSMGRLVFNVVANETSKLLIPDLIEGYNTSIKIDNSGKGYFYKGENY